MLFQTLQIEADPGSRERSQRAELGEPPSPQRATFAASFRRPGPAPTLASVAVPRPHRPAARASLGTPPALSTVSPAPRM